jgi:hypothetical protein
MEWEHVRSVSQIVTAGEIVHTWSIDIKTGVQVDRSGVVELGVQINLLFFRLAPVYGDSIALARVDAQALAISKGRQQEEDSAREPPAFQAYPCGCLD